MGRRPQGWTQVRPQLAAVQARRPPPGWGERGGLAEGGPTVAVTNRGDCAVSLMMAIDALDSRGQRYIIAVAVGSLRSGVDGFLSSARPFGVVEVIWSSAAVGRYHRRGAQTL